MAAEKVRATAEVDQVGSIWPVAEVERESTWPVGVDRCAAEVERHGRAWTSTRAELARRSVEVKRRWCGGASRSRRCR